MSTKTYKIGIEQNQDGDYDAGSLLEAALAGRMARQTTRTPHRDDIEGAIHALAQELHTFTDDIELLHINQRITRQALILALGVDDAKWKEYEAAARDICFPPKPEPNSATRDDLNNILLQVDNRIQQFQQAIPNIIAATVGEILRRDNDGKPHTETAAPPKAPAAPPEPVDIDPNKMNDAEFGEEDPEAK